MVWCKENKEMLLGTMRLVQDGTDEWRRMVFGETDENVILRRPFKSVVYDLVLGEVGDAHCAEVSMDMSGLEGAGRWVLKQYGNLVSHDGQSGHA